MATYSRSLSKTNSCYVRVGGSLIEVSCSVSGIESCFEWNGLNGRVSLKANFRCALTSNKKCAKEKYLVKKAFEEL